MLALQNRVGRTGLNTKARIPDGKSQTRGPGNKESPSSAEKGSEIYSIFT